MKTAGGVTYTSYKQVCCMLGILHDDDEWNKVLTEAFSSLNGYKSRSFFAVLMVFCDLPNSSELLNQHFEALTEDIRYRTPNIEERLYKVYLLHELEKELFSHSRRLEDFGLPSYTEAELQSLLQATKKSVVNSLLEDETMYSYESLKDLVANCKGSGPGKFSESQKVVFDFVMGELQCENQVLCFIDARGGTGKTYLLNAILAAARTIQPNEITPALAVATSGVAAMELLGGRTFHSRFKAPLNIQEHSVLDISVQSNLAKMIRDVNLIVWDEAPMAHKFLLEALDRSLRDIQNVDIPFGGKSLILTGDFRQILPVIKGANRAEVVAATLKRSSLWNLFSTFELTVNMRLRNLDSNEAAFYDKWLLNVGDGTQPDSWTVQIPDELVEFIDIQNRKSSIRDLIFWVFGNDLQVNMLSTFYIIIL